MTTDRTDSAKHRQRSPCDLLLSEGKRGDGDLNGLLQERRILLLEVQMPTAPLIILPFSSGYAKVQQFEQWVYVAIFGCSVSSLVLFSARAAQHRLDRPLHDRARVPGDAATSAILGCWRWRGLTRVARVGKR